LQLVIIDFLAINKLQEEGRVIYETFYNIELVNDKPKTELTVFPAQVDFYNQAFEKYGELLNTPVVYTSDTSAIFSDSLLRVRIYGWVWKQSLDEDGRLLNDENIRYWSNSHIIGRLHAGFALDTLYTNELKSWMLVTFTGFVSKKCLFTPEQFEEISRLKRFFSNITPKKTVTRRFGGVSMKPIRPLIRFEDLIWPIRLVISVCIFIGITGMLLRIYILLQTQNPNRRIYRFLILFISGFAVGTVFWFI
jgi:hypothetical protein